MWRGAENWELARNLSALSRAQHEISEALLHIDCLSDLLNREIIMSATPGGRNVDTNLLAALRFKNGVLG